MQAIADVKQRQRTMSLPENIKTVHRDEDFTGRGKGSTSTEDGATGSVGAPARKGRAVGRRDQHKKTKCRAQRHGRRRVATKPSHHVARGRYGRKEQSGSGSARESLKCMTHWHKQ
jgi:hypothetical protein